jgi:hypothetical protein
LPSPTSDFAPARSACGSSASTASSAKGGDVASSGDIPDTQAFVDFSAPQGFRLRVPEGWARSDSPDGVRFSDKLNAIQVRLVATPAAPTVASAQANEVPVLQAQASCVEHVSVTMVTRRAGPAVLIRYRADAPPDPTTGKVVHDDVERYEFWRAGTEAILTLSSPQGADNVDPWRTITDSFTWTS